MLNGRRRRGLYLLGGFLLLWAIVLTIISVWLASQTGCLYASASGCPPLPLLPAIVTGALEFTAAGLWIFGMIDGYESAPLWNQVRGLEIPNPNSRLHRTGRWVRTNVWIAQFLSAVLGIAVGIVAFQNIQLYSELSKSHATTQGTIFCASTAQNLLSRQTNTSCTADFVVNGVHYSTPDDDDSTSVTYNSSNPSEAVTGPLSTSPAGDYVALSVGLAMAFIGLAFGERTLVRAKNSWQSSVMDVPTPLPAQPTVAEGGSSKYQIPITTLRIDMKELKAAKKILRAQYLPLVLVVLLVEAARLSNLGILVAVLCVPLMILMGNWFIASTERKFSRREPGDIWRGVGFDPLGDPTTVIRLRADTITFGSTQPIPLGEIKALQFSNVIHIGGRRFWLATFTYGDRHKSVDFCIRDMKGLRAAMADI